MSPSPEGLGTDLCWPIRKFLGSTSDHLRRPQMVITRMISTKASVFIQTNQKTNLLLICILYIYIYVHSEKENKGGLISDEDFIYIEGL